jgi:glycosyltransferase involved in cell wall biosynthesis
MIVAGIPAFNEEKSIASVIIVTKRHVDRVIVCDDGSTDMTGEIASSLGAQIIRHAKNMGKGEALRSLFIEAEKENPDVFVTIDADGQHDPDEIPKLVELVHQGADVVVGSRYYEDIPRMRRVGNDILNIASATGVNDTQSGFRAYNGHRLGELVPVEMGMGVDTEILRRAKDKGMKIVEVPISVDYEDNTPTKTPIYHGLDALLSTVKQLSIRHPLLFYGLPGGVSLLIAVGFWWWTLTAFAANRSIITNVAIVAAAFTIVGLVLMAVAIILWVLISVVRERRS